MTQKKQKQEYKFGGIVGLGLSKQYFDEFHQWAQDQAGRQYTDENIQDILNEKLMEGIAQPMARAWAAKMNGVRPEPMGNDYWEMTFMGGNWDDRWEDMNSTLEQIEKRRPKRQAFGRKVTGGPTQAELMVDLQKEAIARMEAESAEKDAKMAEMMAKMEAMTAEPKKKAEPKKDKKTIKIKKADAAE